MVLTEQEFENIARKTGVSVKDFDQKNQIVALELAESLPVFHSYQWLGPLGTFFRTMIEQKGQAYSEFIARLVLIAFLEDARWRPSIVVPASVQDELTKERKRIEMEVMENPAGHYLPKSDAFLKDFSILRGKAMPVYTGIADVHNTLWRRPLVFGSFIQRVRFVRMFLRKPVGFRYYFQHHTHTSLLANFNQEGWDRTYELIADLLDVNPEHKGYSGASWFYDPQLKSVSPRLAYLADIPIAAGAERFHLGSDRTGSALAKSKTRKSLYDEGKYVPQNYMLLWHRASMIQWRGKRKRL